MEVTNGDGFAVKRRGRESNRDLESTSGKNDNEGDNFRLKQ